MSEWGEYDLVTTPARQIAAASASTSDLIALYNEAKTLTGYMTIANLFAGLDIVISGGTSTDNAVARWDGTAGETLQNSVVIIADTTGNMSGVGTLAATAITGSGILSIDDTTDSTSATTGSIHTDGGVGIAKSIIIGGASIVQLSSSAAYTLVASDANKHILHPSADTTARIWTIPANASVAYTIGTAITFVNQNAGGVITISITTDTMRLAGAGTTGSRTLAANGVATALKLTATEWIISGTGLT